MALRRNLVRGHLETEMRRCSCGLFPLVLSVVWINLRLSTGMPLQRSFILQPKSTGVLRPWLVAGRNESTN